MDQPRSNTNERTSLIASVVDTRVADLEAATAQSDDEAELARHATARKIKRRLMKFGRVGTSDEPQVRGQSSRSQAPDDT